MNPNLIIQYQSPLSSLKVLQQLLAIAQKAQGNNPSPVDIKLELQALPQDVINQCEADMQRIIKDNS
jgi:hypothetical protein